MRYFIIDVQPYMLQLLGCDDQSDEITFPNLHIHPTINKQYTTRQQPNRRSKL